MKKIRYARQEIQTRTPRCCLGKQTVKGLEGREKITVGANLFQSCFGSVNRRDSVPGALDAVNNFPRLSYIVQISLI